MKVLHLLVAGHTGGIEVLMRDFALHSKHENIFMFVWEGGEIAEEIKENGGRIVILSKQSDGSFKTFKKVIGFCRQERIDVIIAHNNAPLFGLIILWIKKFQPCIITVAYAHSTAQFMCDTDRKNGLWLRKFIFQKEFYKADRVIAISKAVKESLIEYLKIPSERIKIIYNGVDIDKFMSQPHPIGSPVKIIYVGRLVEEKGVQITLNALAGLHGKLDYQFHIVGDGSYRPVLEKLVQELGLSDRVCFLGTRRDVPDLLKQSDIFVHMPICEEGFGITVVEAMAAGLICICAKSGGIPEIIQDGYNGFLVEKGESMDLASILQRVFANIVCSETDSFEVRKCAILKAKTYSILIYSENIDMVMES